MGTAASMNLVSPGKKGFAAICGNAATAVAVNSLGQAATKEITKAVTKQVSKQGVQKIAQVAKKQLVSKAGQVAKEGVVLSRGAESVNAGINLNKKLTQLEKAQTTAAGIKTLQDGRIRYYKPERPSFTFGPTRGSAYVTEYNSITGKTRGWNECYDHLGNVNRVHPKNLNGQNLISPHYPPTGKDLGL